MSQDPTLSAELKQLDGLMHAIAAVKGVPLGKVIRNASKDFAAESFRQTRLAKLSKSPFWFITDKTGKRRWVNRERNAVAANVKSFQQFARQNSVYRKVNKGYAKASWIGIMRALGMGAGSTGNFKRVTEKSTAIAQAKDNQEHPFVRMLQSLYYIKHLDTQDGIVKAGLQRAESKILNGLAQMQAQAFKSGKVAISD